MASEDEQMGELIELKLEIIQALALVNFSVEKMHC